jgi:DNA-binding NarL/FixJ family response regulator
MQPAPSPQLIALIRSLPRIEAADLSDRCLRILDCMLTGAGEKQISQLLDMPHGTVHSNIKIIYQALQVHSRSELFAMLLAEVTQNATTQPVTSGGPSHSDPMSLKAD